MFIVVSSIVRSHLFTHLNVCAHHKQSHVANFRLWLSFVCEINFCRSAQLGLGHDSFAKKNKIHLKRPNKRLRVNRFNCRQGGNWTKPVLFAKLNSEKPQTKMSSTNCFFAKVLYSLLPKVFVFVCSACNFTFKRSKKFSFFVHFKLEFGGRIWCGNRDCNWCYNSAFRMAAKPATTTKTPIKWSMAIVLISRHKILL